MRKTIFFLGFTLVFMLLTSCMAGSGRNTPIYPAGFFTGIWHGWIAPLALVVSIFDNNIRIYEVHNIGFWYELGFYMAIISGFGGLKLLRKNKK